MHWDWYKSDAQAVQDAREDPERVLVLQNPDVLRTKLNFSDKDLDKMFDKVVRQFMNAPLGQTLNRDVDDIVITQSSFVLNLSHFPKNFN